MNSINFKKWIPLLFLLLCMALVFAFDLHKLFTLEQIKFHKEQLKQHTQDYPLFTIIGFISTYTVCVALSLPIATLLSLLSGFLFGNIIGTLIVVISATLGASILYYITRTSLGNIMQEKAKNFNKGTVYKNIKRNIEENAFNYLLFLRLIPLFPFWLINIVPGLLNIPFRIFVFTTFIGIIPGSFVYVNVGKEISKIENIDDIFTFELFMAFILLGLLALIPSLYKSWRNHKSV